MNIWYRLQNLDSRLLYIVLAIVVAVPLIVSVPAGKANILPQSRGYYNAIEKIAADPVQKEKMSIFSFSFSSSTATENGTQAEATMRHLMARHLKFAIVSFSDPQGRDQGRELAQRIAPEYNYQYGKDYVNWGYKAGDTAANLKSMVRDIPGTIGKDIDGTPVTQIPVMQNVKTIDDINLVIEVASVSSLENWIAYFAGAGDTRVPINYACTAVMAPEAFPYLKSGQISGLLAGLKGAGEYESLILDAHYTKSPGFATRAAASLSYAHFLILFLIILGNVAMFGARRQQRLAQEGGR